jgi:hypothetical protein
VQARVVNFAAGVAALDLRESASGDRYDVALLANGQLQIRRHDGRATAVLAQGASGIADLGNWATIGLSASGAGPVQLAASVNGTVKLTATDASGSAIAVAGTAGMTTNLAGIWFDDFLVTGLGGGGGGDGGVPDAGTPDAGSPDAGTPDAGTPDAGTPDAGTPDAGVPDAGTPDAGTPDAGAPDAGLPPPRPPTGTLFSDGSNRTTGLGASWRILAGLWVTPGTVAQSDLDGTDQAAVQSLSCADCSVQARVVNFAAGIVALDLRESASNDRYDVALLANGHLQIRRTRGGSTTVLGDVASGIADLTDWSTIGLSASGAGPVQLVASVNGT